MAVGHSVEGAGLLQGEARYARAEDASSGFVHFVGALHRSNRSLEDGTALVAMGVTRSERGFLAHDTGPFDFLDLAVAVGDDPVSTLELDRGRAFVGDGHDVGEDEAASIGVGLILEEECLHGHADSLGDDGIHHDPANNRAAPAQEPRLARYPDHGVPTAPSGREAIGPESSGAGMMRLRKTEGSRRHSAGGSMNSMGTSGDFERLYGRTPQRAVAPGRVNLIGEHTDYNDGFVLPMAIDLSTEVLFAALPDASASLRVRSAAFAGEEVEIPLGARDSRREHWSDYVAGVLRMLEAAGIRPPPAALWIDGRVPPGSGLSSSAALEVAVALALLHLAGESLPGPRVAALCRQAENEYVGTRCGIMDPFVSRLGRSGHAIFLDCRSLDAIQVPLPPDLEVAIVHSEVQHSLASGAYNLRREQCESAVAILARSRPEVRSLRDVSIEELEQARSAMEDAVYRRAHHVLTENDRVESFVGALGRGALEDLGDLLAQSHRSLREDFEVSCAELDLLVELSGSVADSLGARMTGGGFGGCTIHLARRGRGRVVAEAVADAYAERTGRQPRWWVTTAAAGARLEDGAAAGSGL